MNVMPVNPDSIPSELKALRRWLVWRLVQKPDKPKPDKVPHDWRTGRPLNAHASELWSTFEEVMRAYSDPRSNWSGVGFFPGEGIVGVDVDACRDPATGEWSEAAREIVARLGSYAEASPSGTGLRVFARGVVPPGRKKRKPFEVYNGEGGNFLTVTGARLPEAPAEVREASEALAWFHGQYIAKPEDQKKDAALVAAAPQASHALDDDALLSLAMSAANGEKFKALWNGEDGGDHSAADAAFCSMLAFWTGRDAARMDRLFRRSGLMRPKWDERHSSDGQTYGQMTVAFAVERCAEVYGEKPSAGKAESYPFMIRPSGVFYLEQTADGIDPEWLCSPLEVAAMTRNGSGREWGRVLKVTDSDGLVHTWVMPMSLLAGSGDEYRATLMSLGLRLAPGKKGRERLHLYLNMTTPERRARCVASTGWHSGCFVLPDAVIGAPEGEEIVLQAPDAENPFQASGALEEWQANVGRYCVGNSRLALAASAAFAGPLLELLGLESGGLHFVGGSSCGKTTALHVAGSVCGGGGVGGFIRQWRATANGLESVAANHSDAFLCLDELGQISAKEAGETAYMLSNGRGKDRAKRDGSSRKGREWRLLYLSSGEVTLADKIKEDGRGRVMAGQMVRIVDVPADAGAGFGLFEELHGFASPGLLSDALKTACKRCYGAPFRVFLRELVMKREKAAATLRDYMADFQERNTPKGADGQVRRVCARFALVAGAGELAVAFGVLPWPVGEADRAAGACFRAWLERRGGVGSVEVMEGLRQVRAFFEQHGASRFETWGEEGRIVNRAGFRKKNDLDEWEYFVFPEAFASELCRGFNAKTLARELVAAGLLLPGSDGKSAKSVRAPGLSGKTRLYHFSSAVLGGEDGA